MTDIDAGIDVIVTHCAAAGTALSVPLTDVARADALPRGRSIRVSWAGEADPPGFPGQRVLDGELVGHISSIDIFWPVSDQGETVTASRDREASALTRDIRTRLQGDSTLGGNVTDIDVMHATNDFVLFGGSVFRHVAIEVLLSYTEHTRSP